jgi:hypothetical protein
MDREGHGDTRGNIYGEESISDINMYLVSNRIDLASAWNCHLDTWLSTY